MSSLIDPLRHLAVMNTTPHVTVDRRGEKRVALSFSSKARYDDKRKAEMIRRRFEKLILMQLDVEEGCLPRTVQQLVSSVACWWSKGDT